MISFIFNPFTSNFDVLSTVTLGAVGASPNANGASISASQVLTLQPANTSFPGALTAADWNTFNGKLTSPLTTKGDILGFSTLNVRVPVGTNGQVLSADSGQADGLSWITPAAGTVVSVGLTLPASVFSVSGSPVINTGTLAGAFITQSANTVFAGPTSGGAAVPTFRALVSADLPAGTGTVTSVSVVTANGVSGSVATATTTPAITLTLGAITPSSVAATGTVTGSNLSGTNTGDLTLTAFGSTPSANAASLSGQALTLQPADATHPGGVSTAAQTFAGAKVFASAPAITDTSAAHNVILSAASSTALTADRTLTIDTNNVSSTLKMGANLTVTATASISGTNTGDVTLAAVGASPSANGASLSGQVLTLQPFDSTHPGVVTASGGGTSNFLRADGTWATPSGSTGPRSSIILSVGNGHGSTNTTVRRFLNANLTTGTDMTLSQGTAGDNITVNTAGVYNVSYSERKTTGTVYFGVTVNGSALATAITDQSYAQGKRTIACTPSGDTACCSVTLILAVNDVVRFQDDGTSNDDSTNRVFASMTMVSF